MRQDSTEVARWSSSLDLLRAQGRTVVRDVKSKDLAEVKLREEDDGGVFIAAAPNHISEFIGSCHMDVPHSTGTIEIMEIVGTWKPFPTKFSGKEWDTKSLNGLSPKQIKIRSTFQS